MSNETTPMGTGSDNSGTRSRPPRSITESTAPAAKKDKESPEPATDEVRHAAYLRWIAAGCPESDGVEFWLAAECDLRSANASSQSSRRELPHRESTDPASRRGTTEPIR